MQVARELGDLRSWCLGAQPGQKEDFAVASEVTATQASAFAFLVNQEREGHVWVEVKGVVFAPEITTQVHLWCTN